MANIKVSIRFITGFILLIAGAPVYGADSTMRKGLTFGQPEQSQGGAGGTVLLTCGLSEFEGEKICNPYIGDELCETMRPLLCFLDINAPAPTYLSNSKYWTGGVVAITDDVRGDQFSTVHTVNAFCARSFGKGWRAASFHDGGGWALRGYGSVGQQSKRVWIDIKDQENGTCWSR